MLISDLEDWRVFDSIIDWDLKACHPYSRIDGVRRPKYFVPLCHSPMSHPQSPQRNPTSDETERYIKVLHNTALIALVACPALIILPPRKLDFYTFGLSGATVYSANFLIRERTGRNIWQHVTLQSPAVNEPFAHPSTTPHRQATVQRGMPTVEESRQMYQHEEASSVTEQVQSQRDAWKAEREKEIKEDIEEGKGFGDMIIDQIWDVWNWGRKRDDDDDDG